MISTFNERRGYLIATVLHGAWGHVASLPLTSETFEELTTLLLKSGSAALGWRAISNSDLRDSPISFQLQQAYRLHTLQAALHERSLIQLASYLRANNLEPLLGKGWAIARSYPEAGLRPYGDFDLYIRPGDHSAMTALLKAPNAPAASVDLHRGCAELDDRGFDEIFSRSRLIPVGGAEIRIFGAEDHLRLLCLHMLRHGAWRPLWLVDVAVALETRPEDFDWDYFLSGDRRRTGWVVCAIVLASELLGAKINDTPVAHRIGALPGWLAPTVLRQWGTEPKPHGTRVPMSHYLRHPSGVIEALRIRWPNAIEASVGVRAPFNELPRLPFQIGECLARSARFALQLPGIWREGKAGQ
ncbi:MAG: nucleotidyltransferase family protein [Blastocatellales bacterium]